MTKREFKEVAMRRLANSSTSELLLEVRKLSSDFSDAAELVTDAAMDILMSRMTEREFVEFCSTL